MVKDNKEKDKIKLTEKQKAFCHHYVERYNGTQAAIKAGYSEKTARNMASENLTKPYIRDYIKEIQKDLAKLSGVSPLLNVKELLKIVEAEGDNKEKAADRIRAIETINKMLGFNAPEKVEKKVLHNLQFLRPQVMFSHEKRVL